MLAQRAANLASQGKRVLVVYYNITLGHYIRDHIQRARYGFSWERIDIIHFHKFCQNFLNENDVPWPLGEGDYVMTEEVPALVKTTLLSGKNAKDRRYDAILIDEGQDFSRSWYEVLCLFLTANDELLLVRDERQNIYARDPGWADSQRASDIKTRFRGPWRELNNTYRLQLPLVQQMQRFADEFLADQPQRLVHNVGTQAVFEFATPKLVWREIEDDEESYQTVLRGAEWLARHESVHPQDIVILTANHEEGATIVKALEEKGFSVNHVFGYTKGQDGSDGSTFGNDRFRKSLSRRNKKSFQMGDGRIKVSTIHSFKGWELLNVLILIPSEAEYEGESLEELDKLIYTALTRARLNVIVYNRHPRYRSFGSTWSSSWNRQLV